MPTYTYVYVYSSAWTGEGNLPPNFDQSRAFRRCGKVVTVTLIERAFRSRVFHRSRSFEGGFVTQRIVPLPARATRHLRTRARAGRRGMTLSDGTPGNGAEATFVTWSMSFKPLFRSRPPNNDPHFPQLTDGRSAVRVLYVRVRKYFRTFVRRIQIVRNYEDKRAC